MSHCKFLSHKINGKLNCKLFRQQITLLNCKNCSKTIYEPNRPIRKVSKKRIFVKKDVYQKVYERDNGTCRLKDSSCEGGLSLHHIKYRSERKDLINEPSNCIMLCEKHHRQVHSNKHYWQPILLEMKK